MALVAYLDDEWCGIATRSSESIPTHSQLSL
jgi:hypothetical protein